jgi:hypothetical protein
MLQREIKETDGLVEIKGLEMKGGRGGAGSVYRATEEAIRIVLKDVMKAATSEGKLLPVN